MTDIKRRIKTVEKRLALGDKDGVVIVKPEKFTNETDEEYEARIAASDASPRDPIQAGNVTIVPPAKPTTE